MPYHLGPGPARVHLKAVFDWKLVTAYDVIATLQGAERPDEWVIRGNHHDAWVNGASDPVSGLVALLEEARAVGEGAKRFPAAAQHRVRGLGRRREGLRGSRNGRRDIRGPPGKGRCVHQLRQQFRGFLDVGRLPMAWRRSSTSAGRRPGPDQEVGVVQRARARAILTGSRFGRRRAPNRGLAIGPSDRIGLHAFPPARRVASLNVGYDARTRTASITRSTDPSTTTRVSGIRTSRTGVTQARTTGSARAPGQAETIPMDFGPHGSRSSRPT